MDSVRLSGRRVRLEPLSSAHVAALIAVGLDESLWRWNPAPVRTADEMERYVEIALREHEAGRSLPFATIDLASGRVVGSTRFGNIEIAHKRLEIGWTWIAPAWQRTPVNTEAKYLMLRYAFEELGCFRVELKTDALNERSRNAIQRIGAKYEGVLRSHMVTTSGRRRDTVYFSVLDSEWPEVKANLEARLAGNAAAPPRMERST